MKLEIDNNEKIMKEANEKFKKITPEKLDVYKLALFPIMLQAIYNARQILRSETIERGLAPNPDVLDSYALRPTIEDLDVVLDAFKSIGVFPRFMKRPVRNKEKWFTLRHIKEHEAQKVEELFNPDAEEYDHKTAWLQHEYNQKCETTEKLRIEQANAFKATIAKLNSEKEELKEMNNNLKLELCGKEIPSARSKFVKLSCIMLDKLRNAKNHLQNIKLSTDKTKIDRNASLASNQIAPLIENLERYEREFAFLAC